MALYTGVPAVVRNDWNGSQARLDPFSVPPGNALYAQNAAYITGQTSKRLGHVAMFQITDGAVPTLFNWFFVYSGAQVSVVVWYTPTIGVRTTTQPTFPPPTTVMAQTAMAGANFVAAGQRLYAAFYDSSGRLSTVGGQIYGWNLGADPLFAAPIQAVPTVTEPSAGVITKGIHRVGYITTTRNGYTGKLQPVDTNTKFVPVTFNASGSKNAQFQISGALPTYLSGGTVQVVMTTVANPNRYFTVPGSSTLAANPTTITFSITDDDLAATGQDVTQLVNALTCSASGTPPFDPTALIPYSSRLGYCGFDALGVPTIWFSDPDAYQTITSDQHIVQLTGFAQPIAGAELNRICYIGTEFGFFSCEDNGGFPVTWAKPAHIEGSIGILAPDCLWPNPSKGYMLIASDHGLYLYQGGVFPSLPVSYYQSNDWNRINWNVPTTVKVLDDEKNKRFVVIAPLKDVVLSVTGTGPYTVTTVRAFHLYQTGLSVTIPGVSGAKTITVTGDNTFTITGGSGAPTVGGMIFPQTATHEMKWDYTEGDSPETVKYSLDSMSGYNVGSAAMMSNIATYLEELWYAPSKAGYVIRQANDAIDSLPYRDVATDGTSTAIDTIEETSLLPGQSDDPMRVRDYHGMHMRVRGSGSLALTAKSLDGKITVVPRRSPITLSVSPGQPELVKWGLRSEQQTIQLRSNVIDAYFILSEIEAYFTEAMMQR